MWRRWEEKQRSLRINEWKKFINETWLILNEENEKQERGQWKSTEKSLQRGRGTGKR